MGGCLVHCRNFWQHPQNLPTQCQSECHDCLVPSHDNSKCLRTILNVPWGAKSLPVGNHYPKVIQCRNWSLLSLFSPSLPECGTQTFFSIFTIFKKKCNKRYLILVAHLMEVLQKWRDFHHKYGTKSNFLDAHVFKVFQSFLQLGF